MDGAKGNPALRITAAALLVLASCGPPPRTTSPGTQAGWINGPHGRLRVDVNEAGKAGGGLPVLFVHGNGGNRTQWKAQLDHLRAGRRAAAFDLHGMGESAPDAQGTYSVESFAGDVAAVADALGFRRFVLVGHSYGGYVISAYAGQHPERLAGLVFADCAGSFFQTPPEHLAGLRRGLEPGQYENFTRQWFEGILAGSTPETKAAVLASLTATPREVFAGATMGLYAFPMNEALARYAGPRLSIASMLAENSAAVHRKIPGVPLEIVKDASHWLMMDKPDEFNRILDAFLASLSQNK